MTQKALKVEMTEARQWVKVVGMVTLAEHLGMGYQSVRNMFNTGKITQQRREQLSELSGGKFRPEDF